MSIRATTISRQLAVLCSLLAPWVTGASAQESAPAELADPLEQGTAAPQRADLTEANELIRESRYPEAEALLATLEQSFPDDPALLLMRGEILLALGRAAEALEPLRRSAEIDADRTRVHFQLATALSVTGDAQGALDAFAAEIEHNDDPEVRALALLNRSMLLEQQRKWDEAAAELERLVELQPARAEVYGDLATIYLQAGRVEQAAGALDRGSQAGFLSGQHYYSLGARLYRDEDYEGARRALEQALQIDPDMARAERSLGAALQRLDRLDEAVVHLRRYLELAPDAPDADRVAEQIRAAEKR